MFGEYNEPEVSMTSNLGASPDATPSYTLETAPPQTGGYDAAAQDSPPLGQSGLSPLGQLMGHKVGLAAGESPAFGAAGGAANDTVGSEPSAAERLSESMRYNIMGNMTPDEYAEHLRKGVAPLYEIPAYLGREAWAGYTNEGKPDDAAMWNASLPRQLGRIADGFTIFPGGEGTNDLYNVGEKIVTGETLNDDDKWRATYQLGRTAAGVGSALLFKKLSK